MIKKKKNANRYFVGNINIQIIDRFFEVLANNLKICKEEVAHNIIIVIKKPRLCLFFMG